MEKGVWSAVVERGSFSRPTDLRDRSDGVDWSHVRGFIYTGRVFGFFIVFCRAQTVNAVELASRVEASYRYPRPAVDRRLHRCRHFVCALLPGRILTPLFKGSAG